MSSQHRYPYDLNTHAARDDSRAAFCWILAAQDVVGINKSAMMMVLVAFLRAFLSRQRTCSVRTEPVLIFAESPHMLTCVRRLSPCFTPGCSDVDVLGRRLPPQQLQGSLQAAQQMSRFARHLVLAERRGTCSSMRSSTVASRLRDVQEVSGVSNWSPEGRSGQEVGSVLLFLLPAMGQRLRFLDLRGSR